MVDDQLNSLPTASSLIPRKKFFPLRPFLCPESLSVLIVSFWKKGNFHLFQCYPIDTLDLPDSPQTVWLTQKKNKSIWGQVQRDRMDPDPTRLSRNRAPGLNQGSPAIYIAHPGLELASCHWSFWKTSFFWRAFFFVLGRVSGLHQRLTNTP